MGSVCSINSQVKQGNRYGRWTVISRDGENLKAISVCECGTVRDVSVYSLVRGVSVSCGCHKNEVSGNRFRSHGGSRTPIYGGWRGMNERCENTKHASYMEYGGRGVTVCEEWVHDFEEFRDWSQANGYADGLELDRVDNDAGYSPSNCRFVSHKENCNNRRNSQWVTAFGDTKTIAQWSEDSRCVVAQRTLGRRIKKFGWRPELAITTPATKGMRRPS